MAPAFTAFAAARFSRGGGVGVAPEGFDSVATGADGVAPAPGTSHGLGASPGAAGVAAWTLSPVAAARSHGFGCGAARRERSERASGEGKEGDVRSARRWEKRRRSGWGD